MDRNNSDADTKTETNGPDCPAERNLKGSGSHSMEPYFCGSLSFVLVFIAGLVATFATAFLTYRHILLISFSGVVGLSTLCPAHGKISCDAVLLTDFAVLFGFVSSAALGLMGSVFVLWCTINGLVNQRLRKISWAALVLYFFAAVGFSWYFLYLMIYKVPNICPWCIVVHVVNFFCLAVVITVAIAKRKEWLLPELATRGERAYFIMGGVLLSLVVFLGCGMWESELNFRDARAKLEEITNDPVVILAMLKASPSRDVPIAPDDPVYGSRSAKFPIIMFSDFQCPVCAKTEEFLRKVVKRNPDVLKLVYKAFPLSTKCNPSTIGNPHPLACEAARAALAAYYTGGDSAFVKYARLLFQHQRELDSSTWLKYARQLKLDEKKFLELMKPGSGADIKMRKDLKLGNRLHLSGTPQIFFQKKKIPDNFKGSYLVRVFEDLIHLYSPDDKGLKLKLP